MTTESNARTPKASWSARRTATGRTELVMRWETPRRKLD